MFPMLAPLVVFRRYTLAQNTAVELVEASKASLMASVVKKLQMLDFTKQRASTRLVSILLKRE